MDAETFTDIALRVIAREASDEERRALEAELAATPARRDEFDHLRIVHDILRTSAPVMEATLATTPEVPAHRVGELRTAVRQHFGSTAARAKEAPGGFAFRFLLRWVFGGTGLAALGFAVAIALFANREVEIGVYSSDTDKVRGAESISGGNIPAARIVSFDRDEPFDQWQHTALAWNEHAKIWIDNEHDVIHIVRRVRVGQTITETQPLAPSNDAQREQIRQLVEQLQK